MQLVESGSYGVLPLLVVALYFPVLALWLSVIDIRCRLLPDRIVLPSLAGVLLLLALASALGPGIAIWGRVLLAAGGCSGLYAVLHLISPSGLGLGDVKLAAVLGSYLGYLGWEQVLIDIAVGFVAGGALGAWFLARDGPCTELPFAPFMFAGAAGPLLLVP